MKARTPIAGAKTDASGQDSRCLPLFAQPLNAPRHSPNAFAPAPLPPFVWTRRAAWGLAALTALSMLAFARPNGAQNAPAGRSDNAPRPPAARSGNANSRTPAPAHPASPSVEPAGNDAPEADAPGVASRRPIDFYTQSVRGNMFSAPQPPAPKPAPVVKPKPPVIQPKPPVIPIAPVAVPEVNPLADWAYTGTVTMDGQVIALLENTKTKEGNYVKIGDSMSVRGGEGMVSAQIAGVSDQMVTLMIAGKTRMLAKSDTINVTPLDRGAMPAGGQPQPGQQPQPQPQPQPPMNMGGVQMGDGQPTITLPNGRRLTPGQFQRRSQRMNNNFNQ